MTKQINTNENIKIFLNSKVEDIIGSIGQYNIKIANSGELSDIDVGVIIVATGSNEFKPHGLFEYNEKNKNIITQQELEQRLKNEDRSWLSNIKHATTIMCVNARQKGGISYCSNICCINTIKNVSALKELKPDLDTLVLFRELHMAKKEYEEYVSKRKKIANYLKYDLKHLPSIVKLSEDPEKYEIDVPSIIDPSDIIKVQTDLIVLSTPMIPPDDLRELADKLKVPLDEHGFFIEAHEKLRPLDFAAHGIFICGCAQWPKNVQDSILEANGAAGRASRFLSLKEISSTKLEFLSFLLSIECFFKDMKVNIDKCNGCGQCAEVCQFKAISLVDVKQEYEDVSIPTKKAYINPAICKGCGRCSATCRLKAIDPRHYDFKQISSIIDPYFLGKTEGKSLENKEVTIIQ